MEKCKRMIETTMYLKEFDIFLIMKVPDNTSAVSSLGQLCDENGYSYEWINSEKMQHGELRCDLRFLVCQRVLPQIFPLQHLMTPSRQEIDHLTSSSSSSTSPTATVQGNMLKRERNGSTRWVSLLLCLPLLLGRHNKSRTATNQEQIFCIHKKSLSYPK